MSCYLKSGVAGDPLRDQRRSMVKAHGRLAIWGPRGPSTWGRQRGTSIGDHYTQLGRVEHTISPTFPDHVAQNERAFLIPVITAIQC